MKKALLVSSLLCAVAAAIVGVVSMNTDARGNPQDVHPNSAIALGIASLALGKASEREA